jgi:hypothetical protein
MAELSSAGNTYATTGGQFKMPLTIIGGASHLSTSHVNLSHVCDCNPVKYPTYAPQKVLTLS